MWLRIEKRDWHVLINLNNVTSVRAFRDNQYNNYRVAFLNGEQEVGFFTFREDEQVIKDFIQGISSLLWSNGEKIYTPEQVISIGKKNSSKEAQKEREYTKGEER